jgi:hypothetical protein
MSERYGGSGEGEGRGERRGSGCGAAEEVFVRDSNGAATPHVRTLGSWTETSIPPADQGVWSRTTPCLERESAFRGEGHPHQERLQTGRS